MNIRSSIRKRGFTILELLISIAIIGILVSIAAASYTSAQKKARDSRRMSDMKAIQTAYEQYYADNDSAYPASTAELVSEGYMPGGVPVDPKNVDPYTYEHSVDVANGTYCSCANLESGTGNSADSFCSYGSGSYFCVSQRQ